VKALLVTDAEWVRNDVAASLPPGWDLELGGSREAVEVAARVEPEAILVDLQVGSMGGFAVVRALRDAVALGQLARSHLILLLDRSADIFLVARSGADGSLIKPFTAQELRRALEPTTEPNPEGQ
jgi:DNA-binding response OmpR family regulator